MRNFTNWKITLLLIFLLGVKTPVSAQVNLHMSDFEESQGETFVTSGNIGNTPWLVNRSGDDWGARIHNGILELTNTASDEANTNGWVFAHLETTNFDAPHQVILDQNTSTISWYFNMRQIRGNPAGFGSNSYGVAFILAATHNNVADEGEGYAIVLGNTGSPDPIRLVNYTNGIQSLGISSDGLIVAPDPLDDPTNNFASLHVTYNPATQEWNLYGRDDGSSSFENPMSGELNHLGTSTDNTYTNLEMPYMGAYWQGSTGANQTAFFDNVSLWLEATGGIPPAITNIVQTPQYDITPETTVSVSAHVTPGDAPVETVELLWGAASDELTNNIIMNPDDNDIFTTETDIPAQEHNTQVYYRIFAEDEDEETAFSTIMSYHVLDPDIDLVIVGIEDLDAVTVEYGTPFNDLPLPQTVTVNLDTETTENLEVNWQQGDYNGEESGTYFLTGELLLTGGISNPDNLTAQIVVVVEPEPLAFDNALIAWTFPEEAPGANYGTQENIGKPITRESSYEGGYDYFSGITDNSISTSSWNDGANTKYWQIEFSTIDHVDLTLFSSQQSSSTGPRDFIVQYRIDENDWQDVEGSETTVGGSFSGVIEELTLPEEMENKASVSIRWIMTSNTSVGGGTVGTTGNSRIDHIAVMGYDTEFVPNVIAVEPVEPITVELGTSFSEIELPNTLQATLDNNQITDVEVDWSEGNYDPDTTGEYLITGELLLPDDITNEDNILAEVTITVVEEIITYTIVSVTAFDEPVSTDEGTPFEMLLLPSEAEVVLDNDSTAMFGVNWLPGDYDGDTPGTYVLSGELILPSNILNPEDLMAEIEVVVTEAITTEVIAGWTFPQESQLADQGIEANLDKTISREAAFEGNYQYGTGAEGNSIYTTQWADGVDTKYWVIEISTIGYGELTLSSKQRSSNTGPRDFRLQYQIGEGGTWTDVPDSEIMVENNFSSGVLEHLALPAACNNKPSLFLRWILTSNTSVQEDEISGGGTSRIDDIFVKGLFSTEFKRIVTDVENPSPISVEVGTGFQDLDLPENVTVIFDDEGTEDLPVTWLEGEYDENTTGTYLIAGELHLTESMENPDNIQASMEVNVMPEPQEFSVTFNVDMSNAPDFNPEEDEVFITGSMFGFAIPGTMPEEQLMEHTGDLVYTQIMVLDEGSYSYKYFINEGLGNPEPGEDRFFELVSDTVMNDVWGVTNIIEANKPRVNVYPNPVTNLLNISSEHLINQVVLTNLNGVIITNKRVNERTILLNLPDLPAGLYLLQIRTQKGLITQKIQILP